MKFVKLPSGSYFNLDHICLYKNGILGYTSQNVPLVEEDKAALDTIMDRISVPYGDFESPWYSPTNTDRAGWQEIRDDEDEPVFVRLAQRLEE